MSQTIDVNSLLTKAYFTLGSNATSSIGKPADALNFALDQMLTDSVNLIQTSPFYRTPAFPAGSGPDFVNAAGVLETSMQPSELLKLFHEIEQKADRVRERRWAARSLDIDLIAFGDHVMPDEQTHEKWVNLPIEKQIKSAPDELILPHPRIQDRSFVLVPLRDVAPDWVHPVSGLNIDQMLAALPSNEINEVVPL